LRRSKQTSKKFIFIDQMAACIAGGFFFNPRTMRPARLFVSLIQVNGGKAFVARALPLS
jgi:hypothetical protein